MKTLSETIDHALNVVCEALVKIEDVGDMSRFPVLYEEDDKIDEILNMLDSVRDGLINVKRRSPDES